MTDKKAKSTVTPIKKAATHQKEEGAPVVPLADRRVKAYDTLFNGREQVVYIDQENGDVIIDGKAYSVDVELDEDGYYISDVNKTHKYKIEYQEGQIYLEGRSIEFNYNPAVPKLERKKAVKTGETIVIAPLPGNVTEIPVRIGEEIKIGQKVLTLEAMKMQNEIVSDANGIIKDIYVNTGDLVKTDQPLLKIIAK